MKKTAPDGIRVEGEVMKKALEEAIRLLEKEIVLLKKLAQTEEYAMGPNFSKYNCQELRRAKSLAKKVADLKKSLR